MQEDMVVEEEVGLEVVVECMVVVAMVEGLVKVVVLDMVPGENMEVDTEVDMVEAEEVVQGEITGLVMEGEKEVEQVEVMEAMQGMALLTVEVVEKVVEVERPMEQEVHMEADTVVGEELVKVLAVE